MKKIILFACAFIALHKGFSQNELTFPLMENVLQSSYINPAHVPEHKVSIGLPGISSLYLGATNTGFTFNEITSKIEGGRRININDIPGLLKKENYLFTALNTDLFSIRVKVRHFFWSFNITEKFTSRISYPKDLMTLAINGNQSFIGNEISFANAGMNVSHFREYGLGIVKQHKKLVYGVRLKYLQGLSDIYFKTKDLSLKTATEQENYALEVSSDATVFTSGLPTGDEGDGFVRSYMTNTKNPGMGIDLGFTYKLSRKIIVSGAINNIGFIAWRDKIRNYNVKGGSKFKGADLGRELLQNKDSADAWEDTGEKYLDSLENSFKYTENAEKYTTSLIPQLYLTGKYMFSHKTHLALTFYLEKYIAFRPALSLALYQEVGRWLNVVGSYSLQYGQFNNIGLGVVIKPPAIPLQFYLCGDQLINKYTTPENNFIPMPLDSKAFNIRLGMNIVFGSVKLHDKQPYPHKKINIFE
ncbi:MAG: hypothetical protein EAZ07_01565 [Cytophagales bacterium]|nr:MAG: hypothetical protein EAZ07_01565 [Cytophagales bacterium]